MVLRKKSNQILCCLLIAYVFFAFLMPLSSAMFVSLCILTMIAVLILNDGDLLCFLAFSVSFTGGNRNTSLFLRMFDIVMVSIIIKHFVLAIMHKNKKKIIFICVMFSLTLILILYGIILSKFKVYKFIQAFGFVLTIACIYVCDKIDLKKLTMILCLGLIISSILSIVAYLGGISIYPPFAGDNTSKIRFGAYFEYVNSFAFYCSLAQTCLLTLFLNKLLDIKKWWPLLFVITALGFTVFSKTYILVTVLSYGIAILLGFIQSKNKKGYIKRCAIGSVVLILVCLCGYKYILTIIERFSASQYYGGGALNIATTGRIEIWKGYMKHWTSSILYILFGCGITANWVGEYTPHNFFISMLYRFGIVGLGLLIGIIVWSTKQCKVTKNINWFLPLFIVLINSFVEDISSSLFTCLPLLIAIMILLKSKNNCIEDK